MLLIQCCHMHYMSFLQNSHIRMLYESAMVFRLGHALQVVKPLGTLSTVQQSSCIGEHHLVPHSDSNIMYMLQTPPMWCGTKHKGEPMSWYAERGEEIERQSRTVHVADLDVWREPGSRELSFKAVVSKGTSMRCLAHDLGKVSLLGAHHNVSTLSTSLAVDTTHV